MNETTYINTLLGLEEQTSFMGGISVCNAIVHTTNFSVVFPDLLCVNTN